MKTNPIGLEFTPGCRRDGTKFDSNFLNDMKWTRVFHGRCKSMGGYTRLSNQLPGICRGMNTFDSGGLTYVSVGTSDYLQQTSLDQYGNINGVSDRTPAAFVAHADNLWQFDYIYDTSASTVRILAHAAQNLMDISSTTAADVWYGDATAATALATTGSVVSGGLVCLQPYLFTFGTAGVINWSVPNKPNDFSGTGSGAARIGAMKIVAALPIRGGAGNSPSGLFWALDSVIRASFVGGTTIFQFDTFSNQASILSSQSVIEYDSVYYWVGIDRFMSFNGVLREVPNDSNLDYFFNGINMAYRQKVFAMKIPRYGEIWWCYPRGDATECTHAVILNLREKRQDGMPVWYDTELPADMRSAAKQSQVFAWPLMTDATESGGVTKLYRHEFGNDAIDGFTVNAIEKSFETPEYSALAPPQGPGQNKSIYGDILEPDYVQSGDLYVQMIGRANARAPEQFGTPQTFVDSTDAGTTDPDEQLVYFPAGEKDQRLMRFKFTSNTQGGLFFMGKNIMHIGLADGRMKT